MKSMYSNQSYFGYTETDMYFINLCLRATDFNKGWSQHCANGAVYVPAPGTTELCEIHKGGGGRFLAALTTCQEAVGHGWDSVPLRPMESGCKTAHGLQWEHAQALNLPISVQQGTCPRESLSALGSRRSQRELRVLRISPG